jgi:hypothetical protein
VRRCIRYSYCLNNPLKYTDPSGEIFATVFGLVGGLFRGITRVVRGEKFTDIFTYAWKGMANGAKIDWGMFKGSPEQIISRFVKEPLQTAAGYTWSTYRNTIGHVDKVRYYDGATYVINGSSEKKDGVTLGNYININLPERYSKATYEPNGKFDPTVNPMFLHEYGHYLQSQAMGWSYLFEVGIPSAKSADNSKKIEGDGIENPHRITTHDVSWYERDANRRASQYFSKKGVDWSTLPFYDYPIDYPKFTSPYDYGYIYPLRQYPRYNNPNGRSSKY